MTYLPLCNFTALIYLRNGICSIKKKEWQKKKKKKQDLGLEVAQLLRALAAHAEDLDLIHSTYMVAAKSL